MITKEQLKSALKELGINKGMTLEVHSSLSSFGKLEGGALTVIDTLKELVTDDGSISCLPSDSAENLNLLRTTKNSESL